MSKLICTFAVFALSQFSLAADQDIYDIYPKLDENLPLYSAQREIIEKVTISVDKTLNPLLKRLESEFKKYHPESEIASETEETKTLPNAFISGKKSLVVLSEPLSNEALRKFNSKFGFYPVQTAFAADALAVYVHINNPLEKLTAAELLKIFSTPSKWGQWGITDELRNAKVQIQALNADHSATGFLQKYIGSTITKEATERPGFASMVYEISKNPWSIGYSGIGYRTRLVKPLKISTDGIKPYVEPTFASAISGDYPVRRVFFFYANPKLNQPANNEFIKFAISYQGQSQVIRAGFLPISSKSDFLNLRL